MKANRSNLDPGNSWQVIFVIYTISQYVSKIPKGSFQGICGSLFFRFFESCCFAFAILDVSITNILYAGEQIVLVASSSTDLMIGTVLQRHSNNNGQA